MLLYAVHQKLKLAEQVEQLVIRKAVRAPGGFKRCAVAELLGDQGADAGKRRINRLCERHRSSGDNLPENIIADTERVVLVLGIRNKIFPSGKHLAHGADLRGNVLDTVDDGAVRAAENNIAVLAHDFHGKRFLADIAELIQVLDIKVNDALQTGLADGENFSAADMLAQQHTEIGRRQRSRFICFGKIDERKTGARRNQQTVIFALVFYGKHQLVRLWLGDFADSSANDAAFKLLHHCGNDNAI
ncbi:hypothetical protein BRYFOR_06460 [Marvinbryantia formatexigens DSM 14469]|uniref:Uncharacterized protein n=1 Tax=Marvinbryantia formatexigens DSM 14469 TaxID=478749 RepID=C6LCW1_9FIRM|nr:hypothetical protein BRYFOR_06460 [Marvinbryantia formatexigens DSM 14469]